MRWALAAAALAGLTLAACGGDEDDARGEAAKPRLVVSAAASMTEALTKCGREFPDAKVRLSFAGSDELAAQIRQGVKPDVYAAANTKLPKALHKERFLSKPVEIATNELVVAVPADSKVHSLDDLAGRGMRLAIGSKSVPAGAYTREVLGRLPRGQRRTILANVRSYEPDVKGVLGKLTQTAATAGFVYASDVRATSGRLRAVELPERLKPEVTYGAGVVRGAKQPRVAERYLEDLLGGRCSEALRAAGFGPSPG